MKHWCKTHNRQADGPSGCDPAKAGIMIPCQTIEVDETNHSHGDLLGLADTLKILADEKHGVKAAIRNMWLRQQVMLQLLSGVEITTIVSDSEEDAKELMKQLKEDFETLFGKQG